MNICIFGAGYVGSALATLMNQSEDLHVVCVDPQARSNPNFVTFHAAVPRGIHVFIICVPTPLDQFDQPDLHCVKQAAESIATNMSGARPLVIVESTVRVGDTEGLVAGILDQSLKAYDLAFSPERISPGDTTITDAVKVVAGRDDRSVRRAKALYSQFFEVHVAPSIRVAEMAKLLENTQRDVNIALMNELYWNAEVMGVPFDEVLAACRTKWNFADYKPGLVGGHCIAVDPVYLAHSMPGIDGTDLSVIETARTTNRIQPSEVAIRIIGIARSNNVENIILLGEGYKPNSKDTRNSGAVEVVSLVQRFFEDTDVAVVHLNNVADYFTLDNCMTVVLVEDDQFKHLKNVYRPYKG